LLIAYGGKNGVITESEAHIRKLHIRSRIYTSPFYI
jgi:hypothetical protein